MMIPAIKANAAMIKMSFPVGIVFLKTPGRAAGGTLALIKLYNKLNFSSSFDAHRQRLPDVGCGLVVFPERHL